MGNNPQGQKPGMDQKPGMGKDRDQQHQQGGGAGQQQGGKQEPGRGGEKDQLRPDHDRDKQRG
jgi:hypothetical protein